MSEKEAINKLWDAIFKATRVDLDDPVAAWKDHLESLERRMKYLNEKKFVTLHYTASNGTDLTVKLPKNHIWAGGGGKSASARCFLKLKSVKSAPAAKPKKRPKHNKPIPITTPILKTPPPTALLLAAFMPLLILKYHDPDTIHPLR